jgi:serine/threonine protein kinase
MGEVYRARDSKLCRSVAIKVLPSDVARDPEKLDRFQREAKVLASLNHPNIASIYGFEDSDRPGLVMELVEGPTLAARITCGRLSVEEALNIAKAVGEALEYAHEHGIVHRDVKPANIKVSDDGTVKLLDFGLAKALESLGMNTDISSSPTLTQVTQAGLILGTAAYMSPEQAKGRQIDRRSDIWAFGCVLFEMLTGKMVFSGESVTDTLAEIIKAEPSWNRLPPNTPMPIRALLQRCLKKDPKQRLQAIGEARIVIEAVLAGKTGVDDDRAKASTLEKSHPAVAGIVGFVAGVALVVAVGWWIVRPSSAPAAMHFSAVTSFAGVQSQPALSPDGRSVTFISNRDGHYNIYVGLARGGELVQITHDAAMKSRPLWSPDGSTLAYAQLNESGTMDVWEVAALGGSPRKVMLNATDPAWTPDGRSLIYENYADGEIWTCGVSGENPRMLVRMEPDEVATELRMSPDGKMVAIAVRSSGGGPTGKLGVADLNSGQVQLLTQDGATTLSPAWSPDSRFIYFASSRGGTLNIWKIGADGNGLRQVTAGEGDDSELDVSSDGKRLVFATMRLNIGLSQFDTQVKARESRIQVLTSDPARNEFGPAYSPDGTHLAFFTNLKGVEHESIGMADATGANAIQLVRDARTNLFPRWSPDGNRIVYLSLDDQGRDDDYRSVAISGGAPQTIVRRGNSFILFDVGRDGRVLYQKAPGEAQAYDPRDGRGLTLGNVPPSAWLFRWSSDENSIAYLVSSSRENDPVAGVWTTDFNTAPRQVFRGWVCWFAVDAKSEIFVLKGKDDLNGEIWKVKWDGSGLSRASGTLPLLYNPNYSHSRTQSQFDVSPDGLHIAFQTQQVLQENIGIIDNVQ